MSNGEVTNEEVTVELTAFVRMFSLVIDYFNRVKHERLFVSVKWISFVLM